MNRNFWISSISISIFLFLYYYTNNGQLNYLIIIPYVILYYAVKLQFKMKIKDNMLYKVKFVESFKIGFLICLASAILASVLFSIVPNNTNVQYTSPILLRILDVLLGAIISGTIASLIIASILPRIKIKTSNNVTLSNRWLKIYLVILISIIIIIFFFLFLTSKT